MLDLGLARTRLLAPHVDGRNLHDTPMGVLTARCPPEGYDKIAIILADTLNVKPQVNALHH